MRPRRRSSSCWTDAAQAEALNAALWTVSDTDFIPHVLADDPLAAVTPVIVTFDEAVALPHHDMLVNLTRRTPATLDEFARVFEIISLDADDAAAGRQRYAAYKKQSYPPDPLRRRTVMNENPAFDPSIPVLCDEVVSEPAPAPVAAASATEPVAEQLGTPRHLSAGPARNGACWNAA